MPVQALPLVASGLAALGIGGAQQATENLSPEQKLELLKQAGQTLTGTSGIMAMKDKLPEKKKDEEEEEKKPEPDPDIDLPDIPKKDEEEEVPEDLKDRSKFFYEQIGLKQREEPEDAMLDATRFHSGVLAKSLEDIGDLSHRITEGSPGAVLEKVNRQIKMLEDQDYKMPFLENHEQNILGNVKYKDMTVEEYKSNLDSLLKNYVSAHEKLPTYNPIHQAAKDAATSIGKLDVDGALKNLYFLKNELEKGDDYFKQQSLSFEKPTVKEEESLKPNEQIFNQIAGVKNQNVERDPNDLFMEGWEKMIIAQPKQIGSLGDYAVAIDPMKRSDNNFLLVKDGKVHATLELATAMGQDKVLELDAIGVPAELQGQGIAKDVLNELFKLADANGVTIQGVAQPFGNKALNKKQLISFYKNMGFEARGDEITRKPVKLEEKAYGGFIDKPLYDTKKDIF